MKIVIFILCGIYFLAICAQVIDEWASYSIGYKLVIIAIIFIPFFINSKSKSIRSLREKEALARLQAFKELKRLPDSGLQKSQEIEPCFELESRMSKWSRPFYLAMAAGLSAALWPLFSKNQAAPAFLLLIAIIWALVAWALSRPSSIKVTHEAIFVRRWWPYSSTVIYLNEIEQLHLSWHPEVADFGGEIYWLTDFNRIDDISFILKNGKKHKIEIGGFFDSSIERLILFLNNSGVEASIVSTQY